MKIKDESLKQICDFRNEIRLMQAKLQESQGKFQVLVSQAMIEVDAQIEDSALCLSCGTVRNIAVPQCSCQGK